jgi:hypothetical protein
VRLEAVLLRRLHVFLLPGKEIERVGDMKEGKAAVASYLPVRRESAAADVGESTVDEPVSSICMIDTGESTS